jgi:predicted dehydrogenase
MINVGVIGYGYWGPTVARNFHGAAGARLGAVSDLSRNRLDLAEQHYPSIKSYADPRDLIRANDIDAVAVVTPVFTHFDLAREALENGKHLFIEKPFTSAGDQARRLIDIARSKNLKIMVDHTFLFTGAVEKTRELIESGELGDLYFYDSVRVNLGLFQHDVNVVWDLAPHDFSIMRHLIDKEPVAVSAQGAAHLKGGFEDIAYVYIHFEDQTFTAHFHLNWLSPVKIRRTLISGSKKMLVWDDLSADEKIRIYDRGVEFSGVEKNNGIHKLLLSYRSGDMHVPRLNGAEALRSEIEHFVKCVASGEEPCNNGEAGLEVVRLLEAADRSIKAGGTRVEL